MRAQRQIDGRVWLAATALMVAGVPLSAQSVATGSKGVDGTRAMTPWAVKKISFTGGKPIFGSPAPGGKSKAHCASDGTIFFDLAAGVDVDSSTGAFSVVSVSTNGEVKRVARKLPVDASIITVKDFYAGERTLVTLLEAQEPDGETGYFLSTSDHDGDLRGLVPLGSRYRPLKVAVLRSGDFLEIGWDTSNLLPVLMLLKDDGTIRRFLDVEKGIGGLGFAVNTKESLEALDHAAFVPDGANVLLTFPGTSKPIRMLTEDGASRTTPVHLPVGYALEEVLPSTPGGTYVIRVKRTDDSADSGGQMFEISSGSGAVVRELVFAKPKANEVTCAVNRSLSAIFMDDVNSGAGHASDGTKATQLVVATAPR